MESELSGVFIWGREPGMEGIRDQELESVLVQKKGFSWASDKRRKYPRKQEKTGAKRSTKRLETSAFLTFPSEPQNKLGFTGWPQHWEAPSSVLPYSFKWSSSYSLKLG